MNNVINKIIEKMEEKAENNAKMGYITAYDVTKECISMIEEIIEEYNNGWILCDEKMPEEHDSIFAEYKDTDLWDSFMFEKASDLVNVTITNKKGEAVTGYMHTTDGEWSGLKDDNIVTAWQPLPSPYKEKTN